MLAVQLFLYLYGRTLAVARRAEKMYLASIQQSHAPSVWHCKGLYDRCGNRIVLLLLVIKKGLSIYF